MIDSDFVPRNTSRFPNSIALIRFDFPEAFAPNNTDVLRTEIPLIFFVLCSPFKVPLPGNNEKFCLSLKDEKFSTENLINIILSLTYANVVIFSQVASFSSGFNIRHNVPRLGVVGAFTTNFPTKPKAQI